MRHDYPPPDANPKFQSLGVFIIIISFWRLLALLFILLEVDNCPVAYDSRFSKILQTQNGFSLSSWCRVRVYLIGGGGALKWNKNLKKAILNLLENEISQLWSALTAAKVCGYKYYLVDAHLTRLNWFHFLILEGGLLIILIDCIIFLSNIPIIIIIIPITPYYFYYYYYY